MGTWTHKTHHSPDSGEATTFPHILFSATRHGGYIQMAQILGTPKMESQIVPAGLPELWTAITPDYRVRSQRGLNQSCSPCRAFQRHVARSNRMSGRGRFPTFSGRESNCQFDSRPFFCPWFKLHMSKWPMRGRFRYLRFKTFPMTLRTPQCEVFWSLLSSSKHSGVPKDSKSPTFPSVGLHPHTWPKWGCDTEHVNLPKATTPL